MALTTVKYCITCGDYFPAPPGSWVCYCPTCLTPKIQKKVVKKIKANRQIPFDWFDLWDTQFSTKTGYERVCRVCGKRLIDSKGTYNGRRRFCNDPCYTFTLMQRYDWASVRHAVLHRNYRRKDHGHHCELCEKVMVKTKGVQNPPVHHQIPVHTLDWANIGLIWDLSNLKVVCPDCHKKQDHLLKQCEKPGKRHQFKDITGYLEKGEFVK